MKTPFICAGYLLPHPPVIVPSVGKGREAQAQSTLQAMRRVAEEIAALEPQTLVLLSPHAPMFSDFAFIYPGEMLSGSLAQFGGKQSLSFTPDEEFSQALQRLMAERGIPGGTLDKASLQKYDVGSLDHGAMVPLHFIAEKARSIKLVVMSPSAMDIQRVYGLGEIIAQAAHKTGRRTVIIASGDMSHKVNAQSPYGACKEGPAFDAQIARLLTHGDIAALLRINPQMREQAAECGYRPLVALCGAFDGQQPKCSVYSYEAPFGIGYCVAQLLPGGDAPSVLSQCSEEKSSESVHVRIARQTLERQVLSGEKTSLAHFDGLLDDALLSTKAGAFVSIKKFGELRGCIGTTEPTTSCLAEEIIQNAVSAGLHDPRFPPIAADELPYLSINVDVLGEAVPVVSKDELDPKVWGVIVSKGMRRGLLLPDLEGVDTVEQQLSIACRKAGIGPETGYDIRKFSVTRYR